MKNWVIILLFLPLHAWAQDTQKKDSLMSLITRSGQDTTLVGLYYQYGELYEQEVPDSATYFYDKAQRLAKNLGFQSGIAAYASHQIVILNNQGKFREALELCKNSLFIYLKTGSQKDLATAYINLGSEWQYLSDFQSAAENYIEALRIAEKIQNKRLQRIANNNLASIFITLGEYQKGKKYAEQSLLIAKELKNEYAISSSTFNIATAQLYLKQYNNALVNYQQIAQSAIKINDYILTLDGWQGIADSYSALNKVDKALFFYNRVINLSKQKNAPEYTMYAYMGMGDLYIKTKNFRLARDPILKGITLATELQSANELKDLYRKASEIEEKNGQLSTALNYRKKFEILNDSIFNDKNAVTIRNLEAKFQFEKNESKIQQLESEKEIQELSLRQKNILNYILIGGAVALLIILALSVHNYKNKQKFQQQRINELETEKQLTATESVLKGEEQERARLAKDLHDGLGGMLSGIKFSFLTMKGNLIMTPDNAQAFERSMDMLDSSIKEMRRVAHNMMPEVLVKFGLDEALQDFCHDINQSGALKVNYQSFGMEDKTIEQTTAITIYRVVQELINNTIKHAAAQSALVQLSRDGEQFSITVEDDGKGFDPSLLQKAKGIGWSNIQSRVDYLKGTLDVQSAPGKGTSVHIELNPR